MTKTLHIVRHAQGHHQLPLDDPDTNKRDADLTKKGVDQADDFAADFPYHGQIDALFASPLTRTIRTCKEAFQQDIAAGRKIILLNDAQEASDDPADTGSNIAKLKETFGDLIDTSYLPKDWYLKEGINAPNDEALGARAMRLRKFLRDQAPGQNMALVSHGTYAHYLTDNIVGEGEQTGIYWTNVLWRSFQFRDNEEADLMETKESRERIAATKEKQEKGEEKLS